MGGNLRFGSGVSASRRRASQRIARGCRSRGAADRTDGDGVRVCGRAAGRADHYDLARRSPLIQADRAAIMHPQMVARRAEAVRSGFGERRLDSFTRQEALTWALPRGRHVHQSVRQFFNHAVDRDLIARNVFARLGAVNRIRRIDRPGFQIVTDEQYQRLQRCARASRADRYGLILQGAILAIGEAALRPGEIFALRHDDIDFAAGVLHVRRQVDLHTGVVQWPKDDAAREVVMSPALRSHLKIMPKLSEEILLPAPRGGYMRRSSWQRTGIRYEPALRCLTSSSTSSGTARSSG
jgi:integrase